MSELAHSKLGASSAERWLNCPGCIDLINKAPPESESSFAAEGTRAHELMELVLKENLDPRNPNSRMAMLMGEYGSEMVGHVQTYVDYVRDNTPEGATVLIEEKADLAFIDETMFGTVDTAIVDEFGTLTVIDFKYGAGKFVTVENNIQMLYYGLMIAAKYDYNFADVKLVVIQPRKTLDEGPIREWETPIETLFEFKEKLAKGVVQTRKEKAKLDAGDWCQFCPASVICPELTKIALSNAKVDFDDFEEEASVTLPDPKDLLPEEITKILKASKIISTWVKSIEDYSFGLLNRGGVITGYKLVNKRGTRKWENEEKLYNKFKKHLKKDEQMVKKFKSPAQMEKALAEAGFDKKDAKKLVDTHCSSISSGLTIAPLKDKRKEVKPIQDDFKKVEE